MATIRHNLQREIFDITEEKLIGIIHVTKQGKKPKKSFLCAVINKETPVYAFLHLVKETDKDCFKKNLTWPLVELQVVDGKNENKETAEFDLTFDRVFRWIASSVQEKNSFIQVLWKMCCRYLPKQKPQFLNVPWHLIKDESTQPEWNSINSSFGLDEGSIEEESDFCALSEKEQSDLEQLIMKSDSAISNAEAFAEQLSKDLSMLDGANIHSMMASESQVKALMGMIDLALDEANKIERRLTSYDEILIHVKDSIEKMAEKNSFIETTNTNSRHLLDSLSNLLQQLEFPHEYERLLINPTFQANDLNPVIEAACSLARAINAPIPEHLAQLQAVKDQKRKFEKLRSEFSKHLARNLNNLFIYHGNDPGESLSLHAERLTLPRHSNIHAELNPYSKLMHWMKSLDQKAYLKLRNTYSASMAKLYERDIKLFFDEARHRISVKKLRNTGSNQDITSMSAMAEKLTSLAQSKPTSSGALLGVEREHWSGELDSSERQRFDSIFEQVLSELEPVCLAEQHFCINFFNLLGSKDQSLNKTPSSVGTPCSNMSDESFLSELSSERNVSSLRHVTKEVRSMMSALFTNLEQQLTSFVNTFFKADSYCCLYIYVRLSEHVLSAEDTGSFLSITFGSCLVQAKRNYDNFMATQLNSIKMCKVTKKKCGILPFVTNFELFAETGETVFKRSERRTDLDRWYSTLIAAIVDNIPRVAAEHQKTPPEVVKMENYHALHQLLSQLKLAGLDAQKKDTKQRYQEALNAYVTQYFGRPLEKLNLFFEGVQAKVASGVKESEVGYQLAFNKQELRKVIKEYPGKEVKKGLEQLYKKVEKHLSEEGNLLQVVWRAMQNEFIQQYKHLDDMIHRCYPGAMLSLEFSIEDILNYFSDIAQSH